MVGATETRELTVLIWALGFILDSSSCSPPIRKKPVLVLKQCGMSPDLFPRCIPSVLVPAQQLCPLRVSSFCTSATPQPSFIPQGDISATCLPAGRIISHPSLKPFTCLLLSRSVMFDAFATSWIVARQAPLSMGIVQALPSSSGSS